MDIFGLEPAVPSPGFSALAWGFRPARLLQTAVRLKLFTALEELPGSVEALARRLRTDVAMTERLLVALAALDLVRHDEGAWRNTLASSLYLVEGHPLYQGDVVELAAQEWVQYDHLERLVREGRDERLFRFGQDSESQTLFLKAIHGITVAGVAQRVARLAPMGGRRTLLDVGGAPGTWSIAFTQRYPSLRVALIDEASTVSHCKAVLAQFEARNVRVKGSEWREKAYGKQSSVEAVLLTRLMGNAAATLTQFMRAYDVLKAHGVVIVHSHLLDNDLNGGGEAAFRQVTDEALTLEQLMALLEEAGFERVSVLHRHGAEGDLVAGYKPDESLLQAPGELVEAATPEMALVGTGSSEYDEDVLLATHRRAWSGAIERLN